MFHPIHVLMVFAGAFFLGGVYQKKKQKKEIGLLKSSQRFWKDQAISSSESFYQK